MENLTNDEAITFVYPVIEEKTREILGKPEGVITKTDVLAITEFEMDAKCAAPFQDLQWYGNLERGSAASHYYSTYQYIDGEPVIIRYVKEEWLLLSDEQTKQYCIAASEKEDAIIYEGGSGRMIIFANASV